MSPVNTNGQDHLNGVGCASPGAGSSPPAERHLWRSLEEASGDPAFEEYLHREFPSQLAVWNDPLGRRNFLKLMAASLAFAGLSGCTRSPEEKIVPYVRSPDGQTSGKPQFFATAMPRGGYGFPVLVESHQGRPTKIEGNPEHPLTRGGTDVFMQASILGLYDPDRSQTIRNRGNIDTWDTFTRFIAEQLPALRRRRGRGLRILTQTVTSPTLGSQLQELSQAFPESRWHIHQPCGLENYWAGAQQAFGQIVDTVYHFDRAEVILALDSDFLVDSPASLRYARDFIDRRRVATNSKSMNRLYVAECTPTITGAAADHRIPLRSSLVEVLASELLRRVDTTDPNATSDIPADVPAPWFSALVDDLTRHRGTSMVIAGPGQPPVVQAIVHAINQSLGNNGKTLHFIEPVASRPQQSTATLNELITDLGQSKVDLLLILGGNPVYDSAGDLRFAEYLTQAKTRIHLSESYNETSFLCNWHIPAAHYLESWGDIRAGDGTTSIQQPLIAPLYDGKTAHDVLSVMAGKPHRSSYEIVQAYWQQQLGEDFGRRWEEAVHDGFIADTRSAVVEVTLKRDLPQLRPSAHPSAQTLEIEFRPDPSVWDGEYANNGWLQELPRPVSKITWDNVAAISPTSARKHSLNNGDVIEITVADRTLRTPVWVLPGQADDCLSLTLGYGRTRAGGVGTNVGYNAYTLLPATAARFSVGTLRKTADRYPISTTQHHHTMEGRDIVRVIPFERIRHPPADPVHSLHAASEKLSLYPGYTYEGNAWGMVIDQTACIGCNACVVACQAENNVPVVGKQQVAVGREMHWLRIDRYFEGEPEHPDIYFQPMMCMHCEQAPCEVVCPVAATVHDSEGTSNMIYNRCVGTRYCSNNCPYKVRRFNYLQFSDQTTASLKLLRNPEVTVRSRGVMEKCSYCIQRISAARIDAKLEDLPFVPDGKVMTACQQACPTRAITFGNLNDHASEVHRLKQSSLNYGVLAELNTEPRTTHLARVTNPHADLQSAAETQVPHATHSPAGPES